MSALKSQLKGLKELRLQFCQTSPSSSGLRYDDATCDKYICIHSFIRISDFVAKNYVSIKKANPELPILVREASGIEARAFARFGK